MQSKWKIILKKSYSSIHVLKWENCFQTDSANFSHKNLTLKIGFLQSLKGFGWNFNQKIIWGQVICR